MSGKAIVTIVGEGWTEAGNLSGRRKLNGCERYKGMRRRQLRERGGENRRTILKARDPITRNIFNPYQIAKNTPYLCNN